MKGEYDFKGRRWKKISPQAKAFVGSLLVVDPHERATAEEAYGSTWLNRRFAATVRNPYAEEITKAQNSVVNFSNYSKLKKVALMVIAHKSTTDEIGILRKLFQQYDTEHNGILSYDEFEAAFKAAGYPEDDCRRMFDACDLDGTGQVRYTEFLAATIEAHGAISEERLAEAFDRIDHDNSGYIEAKDLKQILGQDFPEEEIDAIIREADLTRDGVISYAEFLALWEDQTEAKKEEVIHDIEIRASTRSVDTTVSDMSSDNLSDDGVFSRAEFIASKKSNERRRSSMISSDLTNALFDEDVTKIPDTIFQGVIKAVDEQAPVKESVMSAIV